jgi:hypothetical protein
VAASVCNRRRPRSGGQRHRLDAKLRLRDEHSAQVLILKRVLRRGLTLTGAAQAVHGCWGQLAVVDRAVEACWQINKLTREIHHKVA